MKKILLIVFAAAIFCGCETVKGTATGFKKDVENIAIAFNGTTDAQGNKEPGAVQKADAWVEKNLW